MTWNWDREPEPGFQMTRRRFFMLTGMAGAFVLAQGTGLVDVAERPPFWTSEFLWADNTLRLEYVDSVSKSYYLPYIRAQMEKDGRFIELALNRKMKGVIPMPCKGKRKK